MIVIVGLVLFVSLVFWLIVSDLLYQKDKIIDAHLTTIVRLEKEKNTRMAITNKHNLWLIDVANLTKLSEIKRLLLNYVDIKPKKVDPKDKTKYNDVKKKTK